MQVKKVLHLPCWKGIVRMAVRMYRKEISVLRKEVTWMIQAKARTIISLLWVSAQESVTSGVMSQEKQSTSLAPQKCESSYNKWATT